MASRSSKTITPLVLAAIGGIYLIVLSVPQLVGGLHLIADDRTLTDIEGRGNGGIAHPLPLPALAPVIARYWQAAPWLDDAETWTDAGDLLMTAAEEAGGNQAVRHRALVLAREAYRHSLERTPANPRAWMMLASASLKLGDSPKEAVALLDMSLETGRRETELVLPRLDIAFDCWNAFDSQDRAAIDAQILLGAQQSPRLLAKVVRRHYMLEYARAVLSLEPPLLAAFDQAYLTL